MQKTIISALLVIILAAGAIYWLSAKPPVVEEGEVTTSVDATMPVQGAEGGSEMTVSPQTAESGSPAPEPTAGTYTLAHVAPHNSATSCWSIINGGVYDLTSWIAKHPGGKQAILSLCGKDGSAAFNGQHEGGEKQAAMLVTLKIGTLVQ